MTTYQPRTTAGAIPTGTIVAPAAAGATTPPPLPTPGTGGREELPGRTDEAAGAGRGTQDGTAHRAVEECITPQGFLMTMAVSVAIWAVSGGGYFWPVWVLIGWGPALLAKQGARIGGRRRARLGAQTTDAREQ